MNRRVKYCPIANQDCLMADCGIFNEKFRRCEIGLLSYNMYNFAQAIKQFSEVVSPESKEIMHPIGEYSIKHGEEMLIYNIYGKRFCTLNLQLFMDIHLL